MQHSAVPPVDRYLASPEELGFPFAYPSQYIESIEWNKHDIDSGGEGHLLGFLQGNEVAQWLRTVRQASSKQLVPFARGDNGDWLCCFDAKDPSSVYVINLGEKALRAVRWSASGYVGFLNEYRANVDLPPWQSSVGKQSERGVGGP